MWLDLVSPLNRCRNSFSSTKYCRRWKCRSNCTHRVTGTFQRLLDGDTIRRRTDRKSHVGARFSRWLNQRPSSNYWLPHRTNLQWKESRIRDGEHTHQATTSCAKAIIMTFVEQSWDFFRLVIPQKTWLLVKQGLEIFMRKKSDTVRTSKRCEPSDWKPRQLKRNEMLDQSWSSRKERGSPDRFSILVRRAAIIIFILW